MAIKPVCDICKKELKKFGGLIFGSPNAKGFVRKQHICKECYKQLQKSFMKKNRIKNNYGL